MALRLLQTDAAERPTALFAATDRLAFGAMAVLRDAGVRVPHDFAVVGFDDAEGAQFAQPALTTVKQSFYEAAVCAVDEVIAAAREKRPPRALVRVPTTPVLRRSCGCTVSHNAPEAVAAVEGSCKESLTQALLVQASRTRRGATVLPNWPGATKIAGVVDAVTRGLAPPEPICGEWWSEFLACNRDAESGVRILELLETTMRTGAGPSTDSEQIRSVLRDLRVTLMHEWQRTERVLAAHYEAVTEAAYQLASSLSGTRVNPANDLSWIRWIEPAYACCALWTPRPELRAELRPAQHPPEVARKVHAHPELLEITGKYTEQHGAEPFGTEAACFDAAEFPPASVMQLACERGAAVTIAGIPQGRESEYGLLVVVAPLSFEHLEFVGTPSDWASQVGVALDRVAAERELRLSAEQDALTGLANRATLLERVDALTRCTTGALSLWFIDLDDFKKVNDSLGHLIGDQLLIQIAQRLKVAVKNAGQLVSNASDPVVARLGGDEFVVVLPGIGNDEEAATFADDLQRELNQPYDIEGKQLFVTASIGIAFARGQNEAGLDLLRDADTAMYRAKVKGRARHEIFQAGMHKQALEKIHLDSRLRSALDNDEFELWYQAIVDMTTGHDVGAEALIRWRHPEQGLLTPARFLAVAEDVGLSVRFSEWVIRRACKDAARWQPVARRFSFVNVNVPAAHIKQPGFFEFLQACLAEHGLNPGTFGIEIVESTVLDEPAKCAQVLAKCIAFGIRVAIDDFGTGYSSLSYLRKFPVSSLKIDRSFVMNIPGDPGDDGIARAIITMGQGLGLRVVAEGIETAEQLEFLKQAGCDYGQGYLFSRPLDLQTHIQRLQSIDHTEPAASSRRGPRLAFANREVRPLGT